MKDSTKTAIAGVIFAIPGLFSSYYEGENTQTFMIITWMCIIGSMIISKLENQNHEN